MSELPKLIEDLALILVVAGAVTLIFKKLRQPLVLGYIVAGFLVSPHMPYTLSVVDRVDVQTWADIGVIFLLFSLGLDFSFKKIVKMGLAPIIAALCIIFCMMVLGVTIGGLFGWGQMDCIFLAGMLAMSSTTIIYKAFDDMGLRQQHFASLVMSVLILEDVLAIVMMVMLSAIARGTNPDGGEMLGSVFRIAFFLILWFVVGIFLIPLFLRSVRKLINEETMLVVSLGLCCLMAVLSTKVGFSSAFGAFVMGSILAETVEAEKIIKLVEPVKNLFGAVFFVSVGMLVDPTIIVEYALPICVLVLTILVGQSVLGSAGYLLSGQTLRTAMRCGFSMTQIGEFAFIIASLGLGLGVISHFLYPVVVAVSVITTFLTPYMMKAAEPCYEFLEKRLPEKWIISLNNITLGPPAGSGGKNKWKQLLMSMLTNTVIYSILSTAVIFAMLTFFLTFIRHLIPSHPIYADIICGLLTIAFIAPFLRAMLMKKNHSEEFKALWAESRLNHLPLISTIVVRVIIACSFIFYVCNFLTHFTASVIAAIALAIVLLIMMSRNIKRSSIRMERLFIQNLRSRDIDAQVRGKRRPLYENHLLDRNIHISEIDIPSNSSWVGKNLRQLALRQKFDIDVCSVLRGDHRINIPDGTTIIYPNDRLQVIGGDRQLSSLAEALRTDILPTDDDLTGREMKLRQIVISGNSPLLGVCLRDSGIREKYSCMVIGLEEGKENLSRISATHVFEKGDIIWIVGEERNLYDIQ